MRREPLLAGALLALPILFALDFSSGDVFMPNFFAIPVIVTAPLGRPRVTLGVGAAALSLSLLALWRVAPPLELALARALLLVGVALSSAWVAGIVGRARDRLRAQEGEMRVLAENASDVVFRSTPRAVIEWVSPSVERELGYRPDQMVGQPVGSFIHPDDVETMLTASREINERRSASYRARFQRANGSLTWMEITARPIVRGDEVIGRVGSARCIDRQVHLEEELRRRATTDDLTGATRREEAMQQLASLQSRRERTGHGSAIIFCDIDLFKKVNDTYGHAGGDIVLRELTERLRRGLRDEDSVARFGGDEFVIILHNIHSLEDAQRIAEKLHRTTMRGIEMPDGSRAQVTLSMGVTQVHDGEAITDVLARADEALYEAKHAGRDRVVCAC